MKLTTEQIAELETKELYWPDCSAAGIRHTLADQLDSLQFAKRKIMEDVGKPGWIGFATSNRTMLQIINTAQEIADIWKLEDKKK